MTFLCAAWTTREQGSRFPDGRRVLVYRCDKPIGHEGEHVDSVLLTNWSDEDKPHFLSPEVRRQLFMSHGCDGRYGDDGEMQCNIRPYIDFKRDSEVEILGKIQVHDLLCMTEIQKRAKAENL